MKAIKNLFLLLSISTNILFAQPNANTWTWQSGSNLQDQVGEYGPSVLTPGYRGEAARWVYNNKTYVFGGNGGAYNDLWEYDPATNNWTWIKGSNTYGDLPVYGIKNVTTALNNPGNRRASTTWIFNNKFYMFGGHGVDKLGDLGFLNDLWQYDPATNNWTWIGGSDIKNQYGVYNNAMGNIFPGGRNSAASALIGTKLIVFGGYGIDENGDIGALNDLWEFDIVFNEWTYKAGATIINDPGVYIGNQTDYPAARVGISFWGNDGILYLRGGQIYGETNNYSMSDFWKYEYNANQFTLISGSNTYNEPPVFGQLGIPNTSATPGSIINGECYSHGIYLYYFGGIDGTTYGNYNTLWQYNTVTNIWIWIKGTNVEGAIPEYGIIGVENVNNSPAPYNEGGTSLTWVYDNKLYIYETREGIIHLCAFNLATQNWVTLKVLDGQPLFGNLGLNNNNIQKPGERYGSCSWEYNGKMYVFGGRGNGVKVDGYGGLFLNDLWQYDPVTKGWNWLGGSHLETVDPVYGTLNIPAANNNPGGRVEAHSARIGNKIYLLGGTNNSSGNSFADLWEYNLVTNQWTWIKGPTTLNTSGIYGTMGVANAANIPGARIDGSFVSLNNKIYLFGGYGLDAEGNQGYLNDTWVYDPTTNNWTWLKGSNLINQSGSFGTINVTNSTNVPRGTFGQITWTANNKIYLFGGYNFDPVTFTFLCNTLWEYNPTTNNWTWLKGANDNIGHVGIYGTLGIAAPSNNPGSRLQGQGFTHEGKLLLFGGDGYDQSFAQYSRALNDLWEFNPATNNWRWLKGSNVAYQSSIVGTIHVPNANNNPAGTSFATGSYINNKYLMFGGSAYDIGKNALVWEYLPAITCTSMSTVTSGNWNSEATWSCGRLPLATDIITINAHTIDLTGNGYAKNVIYNGNGTLRFGAGGNLILKP
jgi:N-acetylneuraminic acid mutarotase